jgi:methionine sulfoxide reductase heme-binding subunit
MDLLLGLTMSFKKDWIFYTTPFIFFLSLIPFLYLIVGIATNNLGANPVQKATDTTGTFILVFLCLTLSITPIRKIFNINLLHFRRMMGLFAFFYLILHFFIYYFLDKGPSLSNIIHDIYKRPFITVGFLAFLLMIPLALTSTKKMIKRMGGKNWLRLHKLIYVIAPLGVIHYWWDKSVKHNLFQPKIYATIVIVLLGIRIIFMLKEYFKKNRVMS